jgi:hypothetical protein
VAVVVELRWQWRLSGGHVGVAVDVEWWWWWQWSGGGGQVIVVVKQ